MLNKFLKYDMKRMSRFTIPIMIVLAIAIAVGVAATFFGISGSGSDDPSQSATLVENLAGVGSGLIVMFVVFILLSAVTVAQVLVLVDFYKSTVSDEAYLTFTLPARAHDIVRSKLISGVIWITLISAIVVGGIFAIIVAMFAATDVPLDNFYLTLETLENFIDLPDGFGVLFILAIIQWLAQFVNVQILYFMAIFWGSTIVKKYKAIVSIAFVIGVEIAYSIIMSLISLVVETIVLATSVGSAGAVLTACVGEVVYIAIITVLSILFYYLTIHMMERKLNLA